MFAYSRSAIAVAVLSSISSAGFAELVDTFDIGEGEFTSTALFQFGNEHQYLYTVHYDGAPTGRDLFDVFGEAQPGFFESVIKSYEFGDFLLGLSIGDDSDEGFGTPPDYFDYWHYWTVELDSGEWGLSMIGFSDRVLSDGSSDGWVFDSNDAPIPASPIGFAMLGLTVLRRKRR